MPNIFFKKNGIPKQSSKSCKYNLLVGFLSRRQNTKTKHISATKEVYYKFSPSKTAEKLLDKFEVRLKNDKKTDSIYH